VAPAGPEVYDDGNVARILSEWGGAPSPDRLAARTQWRNRRLAALRVHKRAQASLP